MELDENTRLSQARDEFQSDPFGLNLLWDRVLDSMIEQSPAKVCGATASMATGENSLKSCSDVRNG
jgi:hypothetical protein